MADPTPLHRGRTPDETVAEVRLTNPDRVLFEGQGLTKRDLAEYYAALADHMLSHIAGRPLTLIRCPSGRHKACFIQRHAGRDFPEAVRRVAIKGLEGETEYLTVDDPKGLVSLAQVGVLEIHPWGARADQPERPDRMILDIDPGEGMDWPNVVSAAFELRERLTKAGLTSFVKTTGRRGAHVVVPIDPVHSWEEVRGFAHALADRVAADDPRAYTTSAAKEERKGRIYIDYLRNAFGASAVAPYSPRVRPDAPVSTPLDWEELQPDLPPGMFTVETVLERIEELGTDPWAPLNSVRQSLDEQARRNVGLGR